jgi:type IV fimbrial biogenesis protein FimT
MYNNKGFTLIELIVTVFIAAVIAAIALPASRDFQANIRVNTLANDYVAFLKEARSLAIRNNRPITVATIMTSPPAANNWGGQGWQVTENINGTPVILKEFRGISGKSTISSTPTVNSFRFSAGTGLAQQLNQAVLNITFRVCDAQSDKEFGYDIQVNQFGRISMFRHTNATICN